MIKIYLTGSVVGKDDSQLNEFRKIKEKIETAGFKVQTAIDQFPDSDLVVNAEAIRMYSERRKQALKGSDILVYLNDYTLDPVCVAEVNDALNVYQIPVISIDEFLTDKSKPVG